jgi:beta-glucuronidase
MKRFLKATGLLVLILAGPAQADPAAETVGTPGTLVKNVDGEQMQLTFEITDPGTEKIINYKKYGQFVGLTRGDYQYKITDRKGLAEAAGEGIYPSTSIYKDPAFQKVSASGKLRGVHWDFTNIDDVQLSFYKWASAAETPGVKQYFTAMALERAGFTLHAIKAYHAVAVHFPRQVGWTVWHTPIYYAQRAMDKVEFLTRTHPELGLKYVNSRFTVKHGDDLDISNDEYIRINPGRFKKVSPEKLMPKVVDVSKMAVIKRVGGDHVKLVKLENGHWQLRVDGKPFMIRAVAYEPTPVGQSTHDQSRKDWMQVDMNENGKIDGPYDSWVDKNSNNIQDPDEPVVGDFELLSQMGANALRHYHGASNKELLRDLYNKHGIMAVMGNLMGMYAVGSGADWYEGTDFTNPKHLDAMRENIRQMVLEHKDEPYLLIWVLSNEGNYGIIGDKTKPTMLERLGLGSRGKEQHEAMYKFADEMAVMIKELDPNHPVAFSNGETIFVQDWASLMPHVDIFGCNAYRGKDGFGRSFWYDIRQYADKPVFLTEFGCPAFHNQKTAEEAEALQSEYLIGNWKDIWYNRAGSGMGNAIGGTVYEFIDEWWKAGPPPEFDAFQQDTIGDFKADFPDGWMHEEWLGLTSQGDGSKSPYLRQLRKSFVDLQQTWNHEKENQS